MLTARKKAHVIKTFQRDEADTGSPEVQIGILSKRIDELAAHLKKNKQDKHSRKGLLGLVARRRKLLAYLKKDDSKRYQKIAKDLGLK